MIVVYIVVGRGRRGMQVRLVGVKMSLSSMDGMDECMGECECVYRDGCVIVMGIS